MVFAVDPYALRSIITGRYDDTKSPERRNARPFVNLRVRPQAAAPAAEAAGPVAEAAPPVPAETVPAPADEVKPKGEA